MGMDKAMLPHSSGRSFLDHAIQRFLTFTTQVAISGHTRPAVNRPSIADVSVSMGPAMAVYSSVRFAIEHRFDAIIVAPVDMPDLTSDHLKQLVKAANGIDPTCAVFESNMPHPLVAIYPAKLRDELEQVALSPQRSLRQWLASRPFTPVSFESLAIRDINTPEQFTSVSQH
jgi:molybdenum cofactor guanylyltransferase